MAYYLRAHQFNPTDFGILNNLGIVLWDMGRPDRAVIFTVKRSSSSPTRSTPR